MPDNRLGEMIDYFRRKNNWTLDELGERLGGKSRSAISRWINGERSPLFTDLDAMIKIFNTDIQTLMYGIDVSQSSVYRFFDDHWIDFPKNMDELLKQSVTTIQLPNILIDDEFARKPLVFMRVFSDSLNIIIPKGSLIGIIQSPIPSLNSGDIVVFSENNDFSMKHYVSGSGGNLIFRPASSDDSYTDFVISADNMSFDIIGKVVVSIINYK